LLADESVGLDDYLVVELGARLGVLQESAFALGDGSGKPLGIYACVVRLHRCDCRYRERDELQAGRH
jgi:HK97 family phage major capsid protein